MATCHGSAASLSSHPHELLCSYSSCSRTTSTTSSSRKIRLGVLEVTTLVAGAILSNLVAQLIQLKLQYHNPTNVSHTVISVFPESPVIAELDTVNNKVKTSYNANVCMADVAESSSSSLLGERILPATDLLFVDGTAYGYRAHLVNDPSTSMHHVDLEEKEDDEHKGGGGDGLFQPAGQHLLIDIRNVDSDFLSDVEQLEGAISHWAAQCELMLSYYHCLESEGVSCAGILLEESSQLHLRTTPHVGLISLSLLTTRRKPNIPSLVSVFAHVFGVVVSSTHPFPRVQWSLKKRGYRFFSHSREDGNTTTLKVFNGIRVTPKPCHLERHCICQNLSLWTKRRNTKRWNFIRLLIIRGWHHLIWHRLRVRWSATKRSSWMEYCKVHCMDWKLITKLWSIQLLFPIPIQSVL